MGTWPGLEQTELVMMGTKVDAEVNFWWVILLLAEHVSSY